MDLHDINTKDFEEDRMQPFWICWVQGTDGGNHYNHYSLEKAQTEAERLAKLNLDKEVYLFECVGKCYVYKNPITWEVPCV